MFYPCKILMRYISRSHALILQNKIKWFPLVEKHDRTWRQNRADESFCTKCWHCLFLVMNMYIFSAVFLCFSAVFFLCFFHWLVWQYLQKKIMIKLFPLRDYLMSLAMSRTQHLEHTVIYASAESELLFLYNIFCGIDVTALQREHLYTGSIRSGNPGWTSSRGNGNMLLFCIFAVYTSSAK